uniref:Large ribosomal subunit protein uL24c n=1 Tax=Erythrolobus madagascarensis TaxID=708628 RepID=A0A7S0T644_9RHOD
MRMGKGSKIPRVSGRRGHAKTSAVRRGGGAIPGPRLKCQQLSDELTDRSHSIIESVRRPPLAKMAIKKWSILRGDLVQVIDINHRDLARQGVVMEVLRQSSSVLVKGVNFGRQYLQDAQGTHTPVRTENPLHVSKVALVCPEENKPTPITYKYLEDGTKVRVSKRSGAIIPKPQILFMKRKERPVGGAKDTPPEVVVQKTYHDDGLISLLKQCNVDTSALEAPAPSLTPSSAPPPALPSPSP